MVNTINPADCDRVTVYAGECRNFQDTEWITFNSGRRRSPDARDGNTWLIDVAHGSFWMRDDQVRNLVRLVPARPITRNDLPGVHWPGIHGDGERAGAEMMLDAVVEHLNANGGVPQSPDSTYGIPREDYTYVDWPATCAAEKAAADRAEADADRWRRAHEIVEGERDQAREQAAKMCRERDGWRECAESAERERDEARADRDHYRDSLGATVTERDEWKARAESAEARLADPYSQANQDAAAWDRVAAHPALRVDLLPDVEGSYADCVFERITQLAEVAEARTAPAVTKADIEECIYGSRRAGRQCDEQGFVPVHIQEAVEQLCDLFGVEAEQPVDPVEAKARELWEVSQGGGPFIVWEAMTETENVRFRRIAAHVLGQGAVMSISDRLDEIEARRAQANSSLNGRHMLVGKDVPEMLAALRAVLDLCELIEKAHAANPKQTYEQGMEVAAHKVRTVIAAALGEGS